MIEYKELQRFLCPKCQNQWTTIKGEECDTCYAQKWDPRMVAIVKAEEGERP
jgi:transposase-like protein